MPVRGADYVTASRALGESNRGILTRRILPNSLTPLVVQGTLGIGGAVLEIAALTFVGVAGPARRPGVGHDDRPRVASSSSTRPTSSSRRASRSR